MIARSSFSRTPVAISHMDIQFSGSKVKVNAQMDGVAPNEAIAILTDYIHYPEHFPDNKSVKVRLEQDRQLIDYQLKNYGISFTVFSEQQIAKDPEGTSTLSWKLKESPQLKENEGKWTIKKNEKGTSLTFENTFKLKNWLYNKLVTNETIGSQMSESMKQLKAAIIKHRDKPKLPLSDTPEAPEAPEAPGAWSQFKLQSLLSMTARIFKP